ncbi:hypothetical protein GGH95_001340 [Coemansia sp. RSA 1836]|nr:hypothetical protein GGH95_001340 [Coemansia sp. RSA 1836]
MQETPTSKTTTPEKTIEYLKYLFATDKFRVYMDVHLSMHARLLRWQTYKQNRSSVEAACDRLTKGFDRQKTVICFGSAKIASTMRGCLPTPQSKLFVDCLERRGWRVIMMSEYNTSQVCSACHWRLPQGVAPVKMCKLGDKYDPFRFKHKPVGQHTILRCTNRECRVIWNRDRNAARNMSYLGMLECLELDRPWYFQKKLAFPPLAHTLQPPRPASAATRSTAPLPAHTSNAMAELTASDRKLIAALQHFLCGSNSFSRRNIDRHWAAHERQRNKDKVAADERAADTERLAEFDSDFARAIESLHHRLDMPASPCKIPLPPHTGRRSRMLPPAKAAARVNTRAEERNRNNARQAATSRKHLAEIRHALCREDKKEKADPSAGSEAGAALQIDGARNDLIDKQREHECKTAVVKQAILDRRARRNRTAIHGHLASMP